MEDIFYMVSTLMVPYIVPKWFEPRVTLITSTFLLAFATALVGPFYTELSLVAMIIGLAISGFLLGFPSGSPSGFPSGSPSGSP